MVSACISAIIFATRHDKGGHNNIQFFSQALVPETFRKIAFFLEAVNLQPVLGDNLLTEKERLNVAALVALEGDDRAELLLFGD